MKITYKSDIYAIEPRDERYVKGYGVLSLAKNMGKSIGINMVKNLFKALKNLQQMQ